MLRRDIINFQDIPNVGKAIEVKLSLLGFIKPAQLIGKDPYKIFNDLQIITNKKHDHCLLDVFISAVKYMEGGPSKKWWEFTKERKIKLGNK